MSRVVPPGGTAMSASKSSNPVAMQRSLAGPAVKPASSKRPSAPVVVVAAPMLTSAPATGSPVPAVVTVPATAGGSLIPLGDS